MPRIFIAAILSATAMSTPRARYSKREGPPPGRFFFAMSWTSFDCGMPSSGESLAAAAAGSVIISGSA
jgi:hypothetical protein